MVYRIVVGNTLEHHGVKGQKWGVRRDKQLYKIRGMYDKMNAKWQKKANKYEEYESRTGKIGKRSKLAAAKGMVKQNNEAKEWHTNRLKKAKTAQDYTMANRGSLRNLISGRNWYTKFDEKTLKTPISRFEERVKQFGERITLSAMWAYKLDNKTPDQAAAALERQFVYGRGNLGGMFYGTDFDVRSR